MRAHYLQHVSFEGLGSIGPWLESAGYEITGTRFFASEGLPDLKAIDLLVIMGGPMSVNDEHKYPWLVAEKQFIRDAIQSGKAVLGICLGAQLIASAMGARVFRNPLKEIGWFPIQGLDANDAPVFRFPSSETVFHWHGETFELPEGAIRLATSEGCNNQAFQLGKSVIGLQFHLETTPESARRIIAHCRDELLPSKYIQSEEDMLSVAEDRYETVNQLMAGILGYLNPNVA